MTLPDILALLAVVMGGTFTLAAGAGIALGKDSGIPEGVQQIDDFLTGGLVTLMARFFAAWPRANRQLKGLFVGGCMTVAIAVLWYFFSR